MKEKMLYIPEAMVLSVFQIEYKKLVNEIRILKTFMIGLFLIGVYSIAEAVNAFYNQSGIWFLMKLPPALFVPITFTLYQKIYKTTAEQIRLVSELIQRLETYGVSEKP